MCVAYAKGVGFDEPIFVFACSHFVKPFQLPFERFHKLSAIRRSAEPYCKVTRTNRSNACGLHCGRTPYLPAGVMGTNSGKESDKTHLSVFLLVQKFEFSNF